MIRTRLMTDLELGLTQIPAFLVILSSEQFARERVRHSTLACSRIALSKNPSENHVLRKS